MAGGFGLGFISGTLGGQVLELPPNAELGQDPSVALQVADPSVAPRHAQLYFQEGAHFLVDLNSPAGTFVDGRAIPPGTPVGLYPGALIRLGEAGPLALFQSLSLLRAKPALVLERQDGPRGSWELSDAVTVGRAGSCGIRLDADHDVLASSEHLHLMPCFGHVVATDLGSANGTWTAAGRLSQAALAPGQDVVLGGEGGPRFLVRAIYDAEGEAEADFAAPLAQTCPVPIPELFRLELSAPGGGGQVWVALKPEVSFGSFAGINDFETVCFPRDLEDESDAMERSEAIGPQHGALVLTEGGAALRDEGFAATLLDGRLLAPRSLEPLPESFSLDLGQGALSLRGRVLSHPGLAPRAPAIGVEHAHPVECVVLERSGDEPDCRLFLLLVRQAAIGSADEAAIRICAPGIGPLHALLYVQGESLWITQLGPDPVAVNGVLLAPQTTVPIALGSEIYLGTVRLHVGE